jgi:hypothetical protein
MRPIILVVKWPDDIRTYGGDRNDLAFLLRRYCRGAVRVHVYEETEIIHDVRHMTAALERWQKRGGSL